MITPIIVDAKVWKAAAWKADLRDAVVDYLKHAREEIDEDTMWEWLAATITGDVVGQILVVVLKDGQFAGYGVFRQEFGNRTTGPILHVWQVYAKPGVARLVDLYRAVEPYFVDHSRRKIPTPYNPDGVGTRWLTLQTRRDGPAYRKILGQIGFQPYATVFRAEIPRYKAEEILAEMRRLQGGGESGEVSGSSPPAGRSDPVVATSGHRRRRRRRGRGSHPTADIHRGADHRL